MRSVAEILDNVDFGRPPTETKLILPDTQKAAPWFARILSGEQLFVDPGPQPELFEELIPAECVMLLGGPGGVGKTTLAMMMAICLIAGRRLFGQFQPATSGHVIFFMGEDGDASARRIFQRIAKAMSLTPEERQEICKFLHLVPLVGVTGKLTRTLRSGRLETAPDVQEFCDYSKSLLICPQN